MCLSLRPVCWLLLVHWSLKFTKAKILSTWIPGLLTLKIQGYTWHLSTYTPIVLIACVLVPAACLLAPTCTLVLACPLVPVCVLVLACLLVPVCVLVLACLLVPACALVPACTLELACVQDRENKYWMALCAFSKSSSHFLEMLQAYMPCKNNNSTIFLS